MRLPKNSLLILSLFVSIIGLILIYFATLNIEPKKIAISDIKADMEGRKLTTEGFLVEKKEHKDGHLFLTISDNRTEIEVPLFSDFMNGLSKAGITKDDFHIGDKIYVRGTAGKYRGTLQIVPNNINDVKILGE